MSRVRIELNKPGIAQFLRDQRHNPKMMTLLRAEGEKVARRAGPGFTVVNMERRRNRPGVAVIPGTAEAIRAQKKDNRLGKALGGGVR